MSIDPFKTNDFVAALVDNSTNFQSASFYFYHLHPFYFSRPASFKSGYPIFSTDYEHALIATGIEGSGVRFCGHASDHCDLIILFLKYLNALVVAGIIIIAMEIP